MEAYKRNPNCECSQYKDIDSINIKDRQNLKNYWMRGFIYTNETSRECSCHKRYRLTGRYNRLAEKNNLLDYETLKSFNYLGNNNPYTKLKEIPSIVENHKLNNILVYVFGPENCQKTTSVSKVIYNLIIENKTVTYIDFVDLIDKFVEKDANLDKILNVDWLVIDNCFEGETVNFKTSYNSFYNLLLKRQQPTIIISNLSKDDLFSSKGQNLPSYNFDMLNKMFNKINKYKTSINFSENVDKLLITSNNKEVDIWNL